MTSQIPNDAATLGLHALAATLADPRRAERLLATTGLAAADLRERADDPTTLSAVLTFLEAHEPDLVAVADDIGVPPGRLVAAREQLDHG
ncbi:DUF3572 family protein [Sphingomicrobium sp. XHP0239]|uniref:DUF3572 family protein n=1 Tax=Sphingomicrobium maritimum TaxID=3133972 RepID=UPI0031CC3B91